MKLAYAALCIANLFLFSQGALAGGPSKEDCGQNLSQVREIVQRKFPDLGTGYLGLYKGTWVYSNHQVVISEGGTFSAMGYAVLICPRADKKFDVYWKKEGTLAGVLGMRGRNQAIVYDTAQGDIPLDRAGSMTAGR